MFIMSLFSFNSMIAIAVIVALVAFYCGKDKNEALQERIHKVLKAMMDIERNYTVDSSVRVAVGYGGCLELVVNASYINIINKNDSSSPKHHDYVSSEKELRELFIYFLRHGASTEKYVSNEGLFDTLYKEVMKLEQSKTIAACSASVMASIFAEEGLEVLLGVQSSPRLTFLLPKRITVSESESGEKDEIHLVLEYHKGMKLVHYTAPRGNRITLHNDKKNPTIGSLEGFQKKLKIFGADLLVVGGFQAMDSFPFQEDVQSNRITAVQQQLLSQEPTTLIHTEIPSFDDETLLLRFLEDLVPYSDSISLHEQDLPVAWGLIKHQNNTEAASTSLKMPVVLDYMRDILNTETSKTMTDSERKLSRLHVHTLKYQAIMTAKGSRWKNNKGAVTKAALTANANVCGPLREKSNTTYTFNFDAFNSTASGNVHKVEFKEDDPVWCSTDYSVELCIAPVIMCEEKHDTVRVYDYVTAAGLVLQI